MALTIAGGDCRFFVNNKVYAVTQSVSIDNTTGEYSIYGINSPDPQDIGLGQRSITGTAGCVRTKESGGLQGANLLSLFSDSAATNFSSLRLESRSTGETIWSIPRAKVTKIGEAVQIKGIYHITFSFTGQILFYPLDLS